MKQATKQRIVGTVVLLALGLIFLPIIFDGEGSYQPPVSSRIPEPPEVPILAEPVPSRPAIIAERDAPEPAADTTPEAPAEQTQAEPTEPEVEVVESEPAFQREIPRLEDSGLPAGWVVRLGTFSNADNANNLVERLQSAGYKGYAREVESNQGRMTAVYVGPWLERERVEEFQRQLQEQFDLAGMILRYEVEPL